MQKQACILKNYQLACVALLAAMLLFSSAPLTGAAIEQKSAASKSLQNDGKKLADKWGIELTAMRITAEGHMVDFRYRVLDADKAAPLFKRQTKPYLIHQESGKVLAVPNTAKIGSLRNSNTPQEGRIYWMFFGNHHRLVQKGDKVTVAIGDFRARDLEVE